MLELVHSAKNNGMFETPVNDYCLLGHLLTQKVKDLVDVVQECDLNFSFALKVHYNEQIEEFVHFLMINLAVDRDLLQQVQKDINLLFGTW